MRKKALLLLVPAAFVLFFIFAPVVPTYLTPCIPSPGGPDYASLSNHFFGVGGVYLSFGSYELWTHGVFFGDCF